MLSYMVSGPADSKPPPPPPQSKPRLALELGGSPEPPPRKTRTNISKESSTSSFASDLTLSSSTPTGALDKPKHKLLGNGTKSTTLKRVSFGSSKGSMVETLIYESPLQEEPECSPPAQPAQPPQPPPARPTETAFPYTPADDDPERSKVRVSFYQGARPQCVSPPPAPAHEPQHLYVPVDDADMTEHANYNRQVSTESGWDNPFRPDGDLSREADEIVSLIKGGKPITPTPPTAQPLPPCAEVDEKHAANLHASPQSSPLNKVSSPLQQSTPKANGTKNGSAPAHGPVDVQRSPPQEPQQPEHVTLKKKPKCKCCVVQ